MGLPVAFPDAVETAASQAVTRGAAEGVRRADRTDIPFVTIDPRGSMDLDQAFHAERIDGALRVHYAIADPAAFVTHGDAVDREAHRRGQTLYAPDAKIRLYPPILSEGAASLLPGRPTPAILWTIDLAEAGHPVAFHARRALVTSRKRLTYEEAQSEIDSGRADGALRLLRTIGLRRRQLQRERGGMDLELPEQEVTSRGGQIGLRFRGPLPVEEWNAQVSLLTGMCAARLMLDNGIGLLRTMPPPEEGAVAALRAAAEFVAVEWPHDLPYQSFVSSLDSSQPEHVGLLMLATRLLRGAAYVTFDGDPPKQRLHHALAAPYAHTTAPLRRLGDRYVNEIAVALCAGAQPPAWVRARLSQLPEILRDAHRRQGELERRSVDLLEAALLEHRVGETFEAVVIEVGTKGSTIQISDPAIVTHCAGHCGRLGERARVRLTRADVEKGQTVFERA